MDELLVKARAGDQYAFGELVKPFRDELTAHSYRMLGSFGDAEDVVQEALTRAWRGLDRYRERGSFRAWLYKITTNRCLTFLSRNRRRELPTDLTPGSAAETLWLGPYPDRRMGFTVDLNPEARSLAWESIQVAFVAALQHLPAQQRAVLLLRDVLEYSAAETAELLDSTVAAVNSALQRARRSRAVAPLRGSRPRPDQAEAEVRRVARRYAAAWETGDVDTIVSMLTEDARYSMPPIPTVFTGPRDIEAFLRDGPMNNRWRFLPARANGGLAFGTYMWDEPMARFTPAGLDLIILEGDRVAEVISFLDADLTVFDLPNGLPAG